MTEAVGTQSGGDSHAPENQGESPRNLGLRISRIYTTEGVHPYDEVTWERRDVVMTNWRDGSVNFEQRGVEFPDSWSINAANIVTTKYFRGAVGTPQREWSLRQLIDRVVKTYRTAGERHGYFVGSEDAEIFEHELTWMLLHQVFSFNSPVWFNVGTSAPQQVSACFILSVDDTMESILNWYREEGLIFKGGSGAGLNLSRIRSSKELLSSGGTASGPVSFMRGADASAGTIKSGGATRRAAKMVVLDVDHPDIADFVTTKAREEDKIRALRDAGFDMDLSGKDIVSVQYQNANNSVRVSDEFMRAVEQGTQFGLRARLSGELVETVDARELFRSMAQAAWECADPGIQYDDTINDWHTNPETGRITASNPCSEYLSLDNSSCNLASMNLLKFLREDETFDAERFVRAVELVITAMDISICFADFPTEKIGETTRAYRQLGIGYANLGALLMATARAYDSEGGRAIAAAITSLMTGTAYRRSAELAGIVGPYDGFARNAAPHTRVMRKHAAASEAVRPVGADDARIRALANEQWAECLRIGERNGWRNAQASVLAPTGCLTADTLVTTDHGLVRLGEIGDEYGDRWQDLVMSVSTDAGPRPATRFFVNGEEPTRRLVTEGGYRIQGTLTHRVRVVDPDAGEWVWRRLADVAPGDVVPVQAGTLVGEPRQVVLPVPDQAHHTDGRTPQVPDVVDADLAELVGCFMGAGRLHATGVCFGVADGDLDAVERLRVLGKGLFGIEPTVGPNQDCQDGQVTFGSVRLARWWRAAGFDRTLPEEVHRGEGEAKIPSAILESNDAVVYAAFLRGLFQTDGSVARGAPSVATSSRAFADEVRTLLLVLGVATTTRTTAGDLDRPVYRIDVRDGSPAATFERIVGFGDTGDRRPTPGYLFETVAANEDGGVRPTYDLSVPSNVTYVANGFVSHNTIGLMMGCDTTGIEPDLALVKFKKLVGGGSMQFVNQTVPQALRSMGYQEEQVEAIVEYIAEHGHVVGAPGLNEKHYEVFDCAMGERSIAPMGHVRMMAAVQPFISGGISKTVNLPETATVEDIEQIYFESWKLGVKALAVYRNNCKVGQPLSTGTGSGSGSGKNPVRSAAAGVIVQAAQAAQAAQAGQSEARPVRRRLPKQRPSITTRFGVAGAEGYMTASSYPDDGLGEVFLKMSKQGSTLAGVMDAFSVAISIGLQYGVPLETYVRKFVNMRFDPAGMTDDPDIRIASSVVDYIFRRLALDFLPRDERAELGIFTAAERAEQVATSYDGSGQGGDEEIDVESLRASAPLERDRDLPEPPAARPVAPSVGSSVELLEAKQGRSADAPLCFTCGTKMRPAGSCYVCEGCGSTSGCS
ncbi:MAG TPA: vitamin B12-dependent ribonucleotide reductase [Mycobacteriales bacterium]